MNEKNSDLWTAEIEIGQVQFSKSAHLGLDFYNSIDGWRKMEILFGHKILRPHIKRHDREFTTLHYSVREKIIF